MTAKLTSVAGLLSACAAVAGVLLGFLGLPAAGVKSPTAAPQSVITVVKTVVETVPGPTVTVHTGPTVPPVTVTNASQNDVPLSYVNSKTDMRGLAPGKVTMGGIEYDQALTASFTLNGNDFGMSYNVNQKYRKLTFIAGLDDGSWSTCEADLTVSGDGKTLTSVPLIIDKPATVDRPVDISGVQVLYIEIHERGQSCVQGATAALGIPILHVT